MKDVLTTEVFTEMLKRLSDEQPREWVVLTGREGKELFNLQFERMIFKTRLMRLVEEKLVDQREFIRISEMIDSADPSNFTMAKAIIEYKTSS